MNYSDPYALPSLYLPSSSASAQASGSSAAFPPSAQYPDHNTGNNNTTLPRLPAPAPPPLARSYTVPMSAAPVLRPNKDKVGMKKRKLDQPGRKMMVKVLYSLSSPRFSNPNNNAPTTSDTTNLNVPEPPSSQQHNYTCLARLSSPVWVHLLGAKSGKPKAKGVVEYGRLTLKTCLSAICISRPELVTDPSKDYAVAAVDPYESSLQPASPHPTESMGTGGSANGGGQGLMEGKGMLSWNLAEKREGTTWVCGRVVPATREGTQTRREGREMEETDEERDGLHRDESGDEEEDDEVRDTLEVWLQLVEGPSFTQTQFLSSLRSFANPAVPAPLTSDRTSPPPQVYPVQKQQLPTRMPSSFTSTAAVSGPASGMRRASGDPVKKKKRPRPSDPLSMRGVPHNGSSSSTVTTTSALTKPVSSKLKGKLPAHSAIDTLPALDPTSPLAGMATPQVLALLAQLIPSFASTAGASPSTALANGDAPFDLSTAQGQSLVPAIRVLAQFYGVEISEAALSGTGLSRGPDDIRVDNSHDIEISPETHQSATVDTSPATKKSTVKGKAKAGAPNEQYIPIKNVDPATKVKGGIMFAEGCANCHRKKSAVWRESTNEPATGVKKQTVCNACGAFFNKNGHHRVLNDRNTSPAAASTSSRPLKARLTATCEADLLAHKASKKRKAPAGMGTAPDSPRKVSSSTTTGIFRSPTRASGVTMTSPGRSPPRRSPRAHGYPAGISVTSPVRGSTFSFGAGMDTAVDSDGDLELADMGLSRASKSGQDYDSSAMYSGQQSPSPQRRSPRRIQQTSHARYAQNSSYLLSASPGTALKRILSDTHTDLGGFHGSFGQDMAMEEGRSVLHDEAAQGRPKSGTDLSFLMRSGAEGKQDHQSRPVLNASHTAPRGKAPTSGTSLLPSLSATDGPSTDFDSILSSLRRDFSTRLSSNALTAPSSPPLSSPCVQPRTSSATPGTKGKTSTSSGRQPPSILDSFIDGLVPALVLNPDGSGIRGEDDDGSDGGSPWSPSDGAVDQDLTMMSLDPPTASAAAHIFKRGGKVVERGVGDEDEHEQNDDGFNFDLSNYLLPSDFYSDPLLSASFGNIHHQAPPDDSPYTESHPSTSHSAFDFGSLPASSPPDLPPSEAFATPSDFEGITPDAEGLSLQEEGRTRYRGPSEARLPLQNHVPPSPATAAARTSAEQDSVATLLQSLGLPAIEGTASVQQLLQLIASKTGVQTTVAELKNLDKLRGSAAGDEEKETEI